MDRVARWNQRLGGGEGEEEVGRGPREPGLVLNSQSCSLWCSGALFHYSDPKRFQNIFTTIFTLFTMLTLDDWVPHLPGQPGPG